MASTTSPIEWSVAGVLDEIGRLNSAMPDRALAFVLGSGASVTSGIPTGKAMAENWLTELHLRECCDGSDRDQWLASGALDIDGLTWDSAAEFYPHIFERRFRGDPESGFASLETAMDGKEPSLGYSLLAEIMQQTRHKVVVSTNFDNLVADALAIHAHKPPLIVGHESLTGYVRPALRRPLVAKIHRDLFLSPKNDHVGVETLEKGWNEALTRLFKHYMPLVIGYGGNDGSLMGFLRNLKPGDINGRIFWCYRAGAPPSLAVRDLLVKHNGVMVAIPGFDEFMLRLAAKLISGFDMPGISNRIEERGKKRAASYREQAENLQKSIVANVGQNIDQQATRLVLADAFKDSKNWWSWEMRASAEIDLVKRDHIYRESLKAFPSSVELMGNYALFLSDDRKDFDAAEVMYKKVLELDPNDAVITGNYANFLRSVRKDIKAAELMYKKALDLEPNNALIAANYALFLIDDRKDMEAAEVMYKRALELDPNDADITGNYAIFLDDNRKDFNAAEVMYKKALELDPNNANTTGNYASFLYDNRKDFDAAEVIYKKALELDPNNAITTGSYANLLSDLKEFDAAKVMYKKALGLDPNDANTTVNYANLLSDLKDFDTAEIMYKRALELDPNDADISSNLACLQLIRGHHGTARDSAQQAVKLTNNIATQAAAEALFYLALIDALEDRPTGSELGRLKSLLHAGYVRGNWSFDSLFTSVLQDLPPESRALYEALGAAILDEHALPTLAQNKLWQLVEERPWFES